MTNAGADTLLKLDANGGILQTVAVGNEPYYPLFDGTNIWVPNFLGDSLRVVRPSDGLVLAALNGNGLNSPTSIAFDGQRILVTNDTDKVSLWRAADFAPLGSFSTGAGSRPHGTCSDGVHFWIALREADKLARF